MKWKIAVPITVFGIIGAIIGAKIALVLDTQSLKKFFGVFLAFIAIYEIVLLFREYKNKKKSNNKNTKIN